MSNVLPRSKQVAVIRSLVEGSSIRSTSRMTDVSIPTVLSLVVRAGEGCADVLDGTMRNLSCDLIECDEIWGYVGKKQRHVKETDDASLVGDQWVYVAFDRVSKLIPAYLVGKRDAETTDAFVADLASRLTERATISTDGLKLYEGAIESAFGCAVDYGQVIKSYEAEATGPGRYSPPKVTSIEKRVVSGSPDPFVLSTSGVERQNATMRQSIRRLTRLTHAFSKKLRNHKAAVSLHFAYYNLCRIHGSLRTTPGMAAGVTSTVWSIDELLDAALDGVCP